MPGYIFTYNPGLLPVYNSLQTDHWGYYNGNTYFDNLPECPIDGMETYIDSPNNYITAGLPDEGLTKHGILEGITYPMGAYKQFEYESNQYRKRLEKSFLSGQTESNYAFLLEEENEDMPAGGLRIMRVSTYETQPTGTTDIPLTEKNYEYTIYAVSYTHLTLPTIYSV